MPNITILDQLEASLPLLVARDQVEKLTGGAVTRGTLARLDHEGQGPKERIRIGRKVAYSRAGFMEWLRSRTVELR